MGSFNCSNLNFPQGPGWRAWTRILDPDEPQKYKEWQPRAVQHLDIFVQTKDRQHLGKSDGSAKIVFFKYWNVEMDAYFWVTKFFSSLRFSKMWMDESMRVNADVWYIINLLYIYIVWHFNSLCCPEFYCNVNYGSVNWRHMRVLEEVLVPIFPTVASRFQGGISSKLYMKTIVEQKLWT